LRCNNQFSKPNQYQVENLSMKMLVKTVFIIAIITLPVVSNARPTMPVTRAQVESELAQLEKAGYSLAGSDLDYPGNLASAEARLAAQQDESAGRGAIPTGYGSNTSGTSNSGAR
jgi:hypothetical protein